MKIMHGSASCRVRFAVFSCSRTKQAARKAVRHERRANLRNRLGSSAWRGDSTRVERDVGSGLTAAPALAAMAAAVARLAATGGAPADPALADAGRRLRIPRWDPQRQGLPRQDLPR